MVSLPSELRREDCGALLERLGETRRALLETQRTVRRGCVPARAIDAVVADIDALAGLITGDRRFFRLKAPLVGASPGEGRSGQARPLRDRPAAVSRHARGDELQSITSSARARREGGISSA